MNVFHLLPGCHVERICQIDSTGLQLDARGVRNGARCPAGGGWSEAGHGSYQRRPADLPLVGRSVHIALRVRRFRCHNKARGRHTFAERLPGLVADHARRTRRLATAQSAVAVARGGEAGARLLPVLAMTTSADTLLRLVRALTLPASLTPTALGVDDWSFKRGSTYGTIRVDLETRRMVDLLPDRRDLPPIPGQADAVPLASPRQLAWLLLQPAVKLDARQKATVAHIEQDREVRKAGTLARRFTDLVQASGVTHRRMPGRRLATLTRWLSRASTCGVQAPQNFATGVQQDFASIQAALTTGWSNGQTEGHVNRLKLLKRQMYGRAKFDLLRRRLLLAS